MSSGHLGSVLSSGDQYETHVEEVNGTGLGWGQQLPICSWVYLCLVTALLSALSRGQS